MGKRGRAMRVDKELAEIIEDRARKEDLSLREASKEVARAIKPKIKDVKF